MLTRKDSLPACSLRPVWDAILEVYKPFAEICRKHNLRMWVGYGTLLGAVRHKGFIPWDDDFDVMMPRKDYEQFLKIAAKELPGHLQVVAQANTPEFTLQFAKIQETRRDIVEAVEREVGYEQQQGIYIDIFPLDGVDGWKTPLANPVISAIMKFRRAWLYRAEYKKAPKNVVLFSLGFLCGLIVPWTYSRISFNRAYEKMMRAMDFDECDGCTFYDASRIRQKIYKTSDFDTTIMFKFEGVDVPGPAGYDSVLYTEYGDYMTPPPVRNQVSQHQNYRAKWKFGATQAH